MTYEELSHFTWGDLSSLTWGDLEQPINVLYEQYRDSQLPLTVDAADKLRRLMYALPKNMQPDKSPENHSEAVELLKKASISFVGSVMSSAAGSLVVELIKSRLQ